jgi:hypothetical protein
LPAAGRKEKVIDYPSVGGGFDSRRLHQGDREKKTRERKRVNRMVDSSVQEIQDDGAAGRRRRRDRRKRKKSEPNG